MAKPTIQLMSHPPERRRPSGAVVLHAGCCCCCCCCLHTMGSLIGTAVGAGLAKRRDASTERYRRLAEAYARDADPSQVEAAPQFRRNVGMSGAAIYWWTMLVLMIVALIAGAVNERRVADGVGAAILGLALGLPALQFVASLIALLILAMSVRDDKQAQASQVGKMTLGSIVGTVVGLLVMLVLAGGLR